MFKGIKLNCLDAGIGDQRKHAPAIYLIHSTKMIFKIRQC